MEVILTIQSPAGLEQLPLSCDHLTIGRGENAGITIKDSSLSRLHASINRAVDRLWVLDEGSTNGTFLNGKRVPTEGLPLKNGDEITIGVSTKIRIAVSQAKDEGKPSARRVTPSRSKKANSKLNLPLISALLLFCFFLLYMISLKLLAPYENGSQDSTHAGTANSQNNDIVKEDVDTIANGNGNVTSTGDTGQNNGFSTPQDNLLETNLNKFYWQMSEEEKYDFIDRRAQHIALMMGNRPYAFTNNVLGHIKKYLDGYARRANSSSKQLWSEGLGSLYGRASTYAPHIIRAFNARGVPPVVGLYIVTIETEYHDCLESPVGAKGLFQFMPETARAYGVDPADRCDVVKMSPAAAHYMSDRITEFGSDSMSVALAIAGYNRSPDSVRRDLHDVLSSENRERSFWTLVANSNQLDRPFQNENIKYVPKFFAAAIIGETPWAFGLKLKPLSAYSTISQSINTGDIETRALTVLRRISNDENPYVFPECALIDIKSYIDRYCQQATLVDLLRYLGSHSEELRERAQRENIESALLVYTALAEIDGGGAEGNFETVTRTALPKLLALKATFGGESADSSLLVIAAYPIGIGTKRSHPLLETMRRVVKDPLTERNVWYLREHGQLSDQSYEFVIKFIALGIIAQHPRQCGFKINPLAF
ncbi:MAG: FHA domain-containing protein [Acidobacteriota bacterium]